MGQKMQKRKELKEKKKKQIPKKVGTKPKLANKNGTQPVATKKYNKPKNNQTAVQITNTRTKRTTGNTTKTTQKSLVITVPARNTKPHNPQPKRPKLVQPHEVKKTTTTTRTVKKPKMSVTVRKTEVNTGRKHKQNIAVRVKKSPKKFANKGTTMSSRFAQIKG